MPRDPRAYASSMIARREIDEAAPKTSLFAQEAASLAAAGWVRNPALYSTSSDSSCAAEAYVRAL